jgi:hypothetical protein
MRKHVSPRIPYYRSNDRGEVMENITAMKKLTEEIIISYEARIATVGTIINNTYQALDDFRANRDEMNGELKETLSSKG